MSDFNDVCRYFRLQKTAIEGKGGTVSVANTNPSPSELLAGIQSIPTGTPIVASSGYAIVVAERPNTTLKLYNSSETLLSTKTTHATQGGVVNFSVSSTGNYIVKAYDSQNVELWTNSITISQVGVYNLKPSLLMDAYSWADINRAAYYDYARYMFNLWDFKKLASFMGSTSETYTKVYAVGFNHDDKVGGGKAGIAFLLERTSSSYKHDNSSSTNINGISWMGSLIRQNCLKSGENYYHYEISVTSSTSGTYYVYNEVTDDFDAVSLPSQYIAGTKYYTKGTMSADGAFIAGLPVEMLNYIVQVKKKTWGGYGNSAGSSDNTIMETKDWLFCPSDSEVFGHDNRGVTYSKYALEGEQYEAFATKFMENKLRNSTSRWLRSPNTSYSYFFCSISNGGYVNTSAATSGNYPVLCFCIGAQPQS